MGAYGMGALRGLSNYITLKAEQAHERQNQLDDEQRKNEVATLNAAITSGNLNPDQIQSAIDQMKGLYPKQTHGLLDKFGEVVGHITNLRNKQAAQASAAPTNNPITGAPIVAPPAQSSVDILNQNNAASAPPASSVGPTGTPAASATPTPNPAATAVSTPPPASAGIDKNVAGLATAQPSGTAMPAPNATAVPPSMASLLGAAYPNPIAKAQTDAQAQIARNDVLLADRSKRAQQIIDDMKAAGTLTPQMEAAIRMQGQGFEVPPTLMRPLTGKEPKVTFNQATGTVESITDPLTNESYYSPDDIPSNRPDLKQSWDSADKQGQKVRDQIQAKDDRLFNQHMQMQDKILSNSTLRMTLGPAVKAVGDANKDLNQAQIRMNKMDDSLKDMIDADQKGKPNQQAMLNLVANHLGMTAGAQKGIRITQSTWKEAMNSTPWLAGKINRFFRPDKNGDMELIAPLGGVSITEDQAKQMVALAHQSVVTLRNARDAAMADPNYQTAQEIASSAVPPKLKKPSGKSSGKIVVTPEDMANAGR